MRVVIDRPGGEAEDVELLVSDPEATVAELLEALDAGHGAPGIVIDGRFCHADLGLEEIGLYEGARILPGGPPRDVDKPAPAALELRVAGGIDAGRRMPLRAGVAVTVGRDPRCDLVLADAGVSRRHMEVLASASGAVTVTDLDSANGTWIEGRRIREPTPLNPGSIFEAGDVALTVAAPTPPLPFDPLREVRSDGTAAFNRPPRARSQDAAPPLALPQPPAKVEKPQFSVVSAVGPLVLGGVMVLLLHSLYFALFMLLSPVLTIGGYWEQRRRAKKESSGHGREHKAELEQFQRELARRRDEELERLRVTLPDMAELLARATGPEPSLWERRSEDDDFLVLSAGFAKVAFTPVLERHDARAVTEETEAALERFQRLPPAPVVVDLSRGGVVGVVGPRETSLAVARALLCQAATVEGPADLQFAVFTDDDSLASWEFVKWFPHARDNFAGGSHRQIATGRNASETLISALRERREAVAMARAEFRRRVRPLSEWLPMTVDAPRRPRPLRERNR